MSTSKPRTPSGLGARGRRTWNETVAHFDLRADEEGTLLELCRTLDRLDILEAAVAKAPLLIEGSQGQPRPNPLLGEIRGFRQVAVQLSRSLALSDVPDVDDEGALPTPRQVRARRAAEARWGRRSGA